jgi:hypothetical protein
LTRTKLVESLSALAGTPDGDPAIDAHLRVIVELVPAVVTPVDSASITVERDGRYLTLATSDELATRIDQAQYADGAGPCVQALSGELVALTAPAAATEWPQFREQARSLGLYASLSIPLFAGSGATVASLNLYSRTPTDMAGLITRVVALYRHDASPTRAELDNGGEHLLDALAAALDVHDDIQHAFGLLIGSRHLSAPAAYTALREIADTNGITLHDAATDLLARREA